MRFLTVSILRWPCSGARSQEPASSMRSGRRTKDWRGPLPFWGPKLDSPSSQEISPQRWRLPPSPRYRPSQALSLQKHLSSMVCLGWGMGKPASDMGCRFVQAWWLSNCWGCNLAKASSRGPWFSRQQLRSGKGGSAWQGLTLPAFGSCRSKRSRERPAGRPALPSRLMTLGGSFMLLRAGTASLTARRRTMPCHSWISWLWNWSAGWLWDIWGSHAAILSPLSFELSDIVWSLLVSAILRWHQDSCTWFFVAPGLTKRQSWAWWPKMTLALSAGSWQFVWRTLKKDLSLG